MARRASRRRGQALVESALVIISMLLMILGIMDFGQVLMYMQHMNERARAGARWASVHAYSDTAIRNYVCYNDPAGRSGNPPGTYGLQPQHVTVSTQTVGGEMVIAVRVQKPLRFFSPYLAHAFMPRPAIAYSAAESLGANN